MSSPANTSSPTDTRLATTPATARAVGATKIYGTGPLAVTALDHVDLAFAAGQLTAIMGPSGSGKSTLLHVMAGLDRLDGGSVFVGETDLTALDRHQLTLFRRDHIGFVFQSYNLIPTLTAIENVCLPLALARRSGDRSWIDDVIDTVGLTQRQHHRPAELSGGQQQRVAVARALVGRPGIVFADEPTGNLDSRSAAEVLGLLRQAARERHQTIAMVTHDPSAAVYANRVVFLADGRVVAETAEPTVDSLLNTMRDLGA